MVTPYPTNIGRILIVDDENDITGLFVELMRETGYEVHSAGDGEEALQIIASHKPDIVVSDIHMPSMDGDELYRRALKIKPSYADRFIFMTGSEIDSKLRKFLSDTGCAMILKPFDLQELTSIINSKIDENEG